MSVSGQLITQQVPAAAPEFVRRWSQSALREQQGSQSHFNELCHLIGHPAPTEADPAGTQFTFEKQVIKADGKAGRVDVWYHKHFAWEYKSKYKDLDEAYNQLLSYKNALDNPPLLVVCDFDQYRIYPQWTNTNAEPFTFSNVDLLQPRKLAYIRWLLTDPNEFLEERKRELGERAAITEKLAKQFATLADQLREYKREGQPVWSSLQVARFLTKLVFALFAEDIGLLPKVIDRPIFRYLTEKAYRMPAEFSPALRELFAAMNGERASFYMEPVPYFNGGLFKESSAGANDGTEVLDLADEAVTAGALLTLETVANADWRKVNPTIFGTLFEAALDKGKRAQLGAHYTSEADIRLIVEPVLMAPLQREWGDIRTTAESVMQVFNNPDTSPRNRQAARATLTLAHDAMLDRLGSVRVLDPACGSGNFLYVSFKALKDLESHIHRFFEPLNLPFRDVVTPRQLFGIEKDEFAAKLAQIVVWIGYLQWRYEAAGTLIPVSGEPTNPREIRTPILSDLDEGGTARILNDDAVLRYDAAGKAYEPEWPPADVIVGNPPFLGGKRLRAELDAQYVNQIFDLYNGRVPHEADLVCYWFEKARSHIEQNKTKRAGLLATNSIRGGANRAVLDRIKQTGDIFLAWGDRPWVLGGAAVRISVIAFDDGAQKDYVLDGAPVLQINADLQNTIDATKARPLLQNKGIAFMADTKNGPFDISAAQAHELLQAVNKSLRSNSDVVRPWVNGLDITRRNREMWIIDFGVEMGLEEAQLYEAPFDYVQRIVWPERKKSTTARAREVWWRHEAPRPEMRKALKPVSRFIATPSLSKYRLFVWMAHETLPDHQLIVVARDDDYFFGVMHAHLHEAWALRLGTSLGPTPRYTPTTTFETFPFPWPPGTEPQADPKLQAIAEAAKTLNAERESWLNPPGLSGAALKKRTLTNLYNALESYREHQRAGKPWHIVESEPGTTFAARLAALHTALDNAVLAAYGWDDLADRLRTPDGDEEMLRRLLALNMARGRG